MHEYQIADILQKRIDLYEREIERCHNSIQESYSGGNTNVCFL